MLEWNHPFSGNVSRIEEGKRSKRSYTVTKTLKETLGIVALYIKGNEPIRVTSDAEFSLEDLK